jgi:hypothetical protein
MPDIKDLPFLLKLMDDDSDAIQAHIMGALRSFGPELECLVGPLLGDLPEDQAHFIRQMAQELRASAFESGWAQWLDDMEAPGALEHALSQLAFREFGAAEPRLEELIDELVHRFEYALLPHTPEGLIRFLFQLEGFGGPPRDFHDPIKNNLVHVIQAREGTQISLAALAIMMGQRLLIPLQGVSVPGHFMVMYSASGCIKMFNPFGMGQELSKDAVQSIVQSHFASDSTRERDLYMETHEIVLMILRNQIHSCCWKSWPEQAQVYVNLFEGLIRVLKGRGIEV